VHEQGERTGVRLVVSMRTNMSPSRFPVPSRAIGGMLIVSAVAAMPASGAQPDPSADPKFAPAAERAKQEGDKVYKWILINGVAPKRAAEPAASAASAARHLVKARTDAPAAPAKPPERSTALAVKPRPAAATASAAPTGTQEAASALAMPTVHEPVSDLPSMPNASQATASAPPQEGEEQQLVLMHQVDPEFPAAIVRRQKKGSVVVRFEVQVDGSVKQAEVLKSSNPRLDAAVLSAVSEWRFQPLQHPQSASAELAFDVSQSLAE